MSLNPLDYSPKQIFKALVAGGVSACILLSLLGQSFTDGPLKDVGLWAIAIFAVLNPIIVFLKKAEPVIEPMFPDNEGAKQSILEKGEEQ